MLKSLHIRNFVLIDRLDITFDQGFSVVTGETGAGKSIILGALGLVLGGRADAKSARAGADKCVIEAEFDISDYGLEDFFRQNDLEYDATCCLLRRELTAAGKSRAFINDSPVPLSTVKALGDHLIDIHSQHQNLLLADTRFQLNVVDIMAQVGPLMQAYTERYNAFRAAEHRLDELKAAAEKNSQNADYLRFQVDELTAARLQPGEQAALEAELETLAHAEEIKEALYKVAGALGDDEAGVLIRLNESATAMEGIAAYLPAATEYAERLRSALIDLTDLHRDVDSLKEDVDFDPDRMAFVNDRLNIIYNLQRKHRVETIEALLALLSDYTAQLAAIDSFDERLATLTRERDEAREALLTQAAALTKRRTEAAAGIERNLVERMRTLGIPNTRFRIDFTPRPKPAADGMDEVAFLFSANKNEELRPVAQTASGGEISRLMLCIKAMIAGFAALPAIIFDEIDTGVSGDISDRMADIMQDLGRKMQVITITHQPQIAARGHAHFFVYKEDTADRTLTRIRPLTPDERVSEIARMLSGATLTDAAIANARALLHMQ